MDSHIDELIALLGSQDDMTSHFAEVELRKLGAPVIPALIQAFKSRDTADRYRIKRFVGNAGTAAVPVLIHALSDEDGSLRKMAAQILGPIRDISAVPALIEALKDPIREIRHAAAYALGLIGDSSAVPALLDCLTDVIPSEFDFGAAAAGALGMIGDASAVPALILALKDDDWHLRCGAASALGKIGNASAAPALIEMYEDVASIKGMLLWPYGPLETRDRFLARSWLQGPFRRRHAQTPWTEYAGFAIGYLQS